jgi:hypothetical protein
VTSVPSTSDYAEVAIVDPAAPTTRWGRIWDFVETRLAVLADRANPILVKETRQALKSRQFVVTFIIVLVACWVVSFAAVAIIGPQMYYSATGATMFMWYYGILAFPLAVIVPYSAFRSLATEQEDNTYDLLSITTLSSRQIISGKLWSAVMQMVVYLSAVAPCLAFTFLLRGVDPFIAAFLLTIAIMGCLGLAMISLFIGAAARAKHTQIITSVALILGLFGAFWLACFMATELAEEAMPRDPEFYAAMLVILTIFVTTFGLLHAAAAAQIAFASENRSTPVRRWMMAQQACLVGGMAGFLYVLGQHGQNYREGAFVTAILAGVYWMVAGALMTSEWPHLSRRVQRSLPQSTMGRTCLSFFNPGPGSGYLFAVSNLTAICLAGLMLVFLGGGRPGMGTDRMATGIVLVWGYMVGYLGLGRLAIMWLRRFSYVSLTAGFLIHVLIVLAGVGVPLTIQLTSRALRNSGYSLLQVSNPIWSVYESIERGLGPTEALVLLLTVPGFAIAMLLLNMKSIAAELLRHRVAAPARVLEDEAELHPEPAPQPTNPWDADETNAAAP